MELWNRYHQFICFVAAIVTCLLFNLLAVKCAGDSYRQGQQTILRTYEESMDRLDSLQKQNEDALNRVLKEREHTLKEIISDSLIDKAQGLCPQQKEAVRKYVQPYLEVTTRELDVEERMKVNPSHDLQLLRNEIKSLLELEFNKLQNEYEALELWAAILTVVFLIFSFYSFFKTERLEDQSRESVTRINRIEGDARTNLDNLQQEITRDYQTQTDRFAAAFDDVITEQTDRLQAIETEVNEVFQGYQNRLETFMNEIRDRQDRHEDEEGAEDAADEEDDNMEDEIQEGGAE